jgi:hypothetical protein
MRFALVVAIFISLEGCASLPPIMQRWADLEIARFTIWRVDSRPEESYLFTDDGLAQLPVPLGQILQNARKVPWRVRGPWLEIDTSDDGTFKTRLRVVALDPAKQRLLPESPSGKRSVWGYTSVRIVVGMEEPNRTGLWIP